MQFLISLLKCFRSQTALAAENAMLRHQIMVLQRSVKRPRLTRSDRLVWVLMSLMCARWKSWLMIVRPETVVSWHRAGVRLLWRWRSRGGRPPIRPDLQSLIARIAAENPLWGIPRIQAELAMLGPAPVQGALRSP